MPAVPSLRLRPLMRVSFLLVLCSSPGFVSSSWAETGERRTYQVPADNLGAALTRFAGLAGVNLS